MRIALPVQLIREMDSVILRGLGGYSTRAEFIEDAIHERILELTIAGVEDAGPPEHIVAPTSTLVDAPLGPTPADVPPGMRDAATATTIAASDPGFVIEDEDASVPEGKPIFGLHNRDFPSLWALAELANFAREQPTPIESFYAQALAAAWALGATLADFETRTGKKYTPLFPTNPEKRKAAEAAFRMFAIGDYKVGATTVATHGPLFEWRVAAVTLGNDGPRIGLSAPGWKLLSAMEGVSVEAPHSPEQALSFLDHLVEHAPADYSGFIQVLRGIGTDGATRQDLLGHFSNVWPDWTDNEVSTNAAGYTARAREWGLVELKQIKGRYRLTSFGINQLATRNAGALQ